MGKEKICRNKIQANAWVDKWRKQGYNPEIKVLPKPFQKFYKSKYLVVTGSKKRKKKGRK